MQNSDKKILVQILFLAVMAGLFSYEKACALTLNQAGSEQVVVESRIVYVNHKDRDFGIDFGIAVNPTPEGGAKIEVSAMARGQGADFRRWIPQHAELILPDKQRITPISTEKTYFQKPSAVSGVVPILFAALGSQYVGNAAQAEARPGQVCPVTGQVERSSGEKHTGVPEAIYRVGMAAGLGLLSSQAKGELEGQKSTFILKDLPLMGLEFRTEVRNTDKNNLVIVVVPVILKPAE